MSFIRRYGYFPGSEVITQIEGVIIVDAPPPGAVNGIATGVVAMVGEYADMGSSVAVDASGNITTLIQPQEIFSSKDMIDKVGGFDETLGDFGGSCGNGYVALRNKQFSRLVCVAVNLCSVRGIRLWRQLPTSKGATDTNSIVPVPSVSLAAGTEFRNGSGRMRLGTRVSFTSFDPIASGVAASFAVAGSAASQVITINGGLDWSTIVRPDGSLGARKGDILVVGYNSGGTATPTGEAGTYRVLTDAASATPLSIQRLDGTSFAVTLQTGVVWRLHQGSDADSAPVRVPGAASPGGYALADVGGFSVPVRPLTTGAGTTVDGTWTSGTTLTPAVSAPAATGSSYDALSGLAGLTYNGGTLAFTAAVQGINAAANATLDAAYATAIDTLLADKDPVRDVNILVAARKSQSINTKLKAHVLDASSRGIGRICSISPPLSVQTTSAAGADTYPGVGALRDESVTYAWPGVRHFVPEAVNFRLKSADGATTVDGVLDDPADGWLASVMSNLAPERNPGQAAAPVPQILAQVIGLQRQAPDLGMPEYTFLRNKGIVAIKMDRTAGPIFQSGITTSLVSGQKNINRRRFSFFCQDSMAARLVQWAKLPFSNQMRDGSVGEITAFCEELLSPDNPAAQRIAAYQVDDKSGNTPNLLAKGIVVIIVRIKMIPTADFIVLQCEVGEGVRIQQLAA